MRRYGPRANQSVPARQTPPIGRPTDRDPAFDDDKERMSAHPRIPARSVAHQWLLLKALIRLQGTRSLHAGRPTGSVTDTVELQGSKSAAPPANSAGIPQQQPQPTTGAAPVAPLYGEAAYRALGESSFARLASGATGAEDAHPETRITPVEPAGARAAHTPLEGTPRGLLSNVEYAPHQANRWVTLAQHRKLGPESLVAGRRTHRATGSVPLSSTRRAVRAFGAIWRRWPLLALLLFWFLAGLSTGIAAPSLLPAWGIGFLGLVVLGFVASTLRAMR